MSPCVAAYCESTHSKLRFKSCKPPITGRFHAIGAAGFEPTTPTTPKSIENYLNRFPEKLLRFFINAADVFSTLETFM